MYMHNVVLLFIVRSKDEEKSDVKKYAKKSSDVNKKRILSSMTATDRYMYIHVQYTTYMFHCMYHTVCILYPCTVYCIILCMPQCSHGLHCIVCIIYTVHYIHVPVYVFLFITSL